jgi:hypothetical protein
MQDQQPVVVMISGKIPDAFEGWLNQGYVSIGSLEGKRQHIFVRADQVAVQEVIGNWPLDK